MRVWVTRAEPGASRTAERLRALGHEPVVEPVLEVRPLEADLDLHGIAAFAFSSINGVEAFAARSSERDLPVFAVGDATAEAARAAGFGRVASAAGDVVALGELIGRELPHGSVVLHPGAREPAGDLAAAVGPGVTVRAVAVYETIARKAAPSTVDAVLVHSPKAGRELIALDVPGEPAWLCISEAAAAPLREAGRAPIRVAPEPNEAALLHLLFRLDHNGAW